VSAIFRRLASRLAASTLPPFGSDSAGGSGGSGGTGGFGGSGGIGGTGGTGFWSVVGSVGAMAVSSAYIGLELDGPRNASTMDVAVIVPSLRRARWAAAGPPTPRLPGEPALLR
jgi:hypothetical protein